MPDMKWLMMWGFFVSLHDEIEVDSIDVFLSVDTTSYAFFRRAFFLAGRLIPDSCVCQRGQRHHSAYGVEARRL